jgi:hypothetical protein
MGVTVIQGSVYLLLSTFICSALSPTARAVVFLAWLS